MSFYIQKLFSEYKNHLSFDELVLKDHEFNSTEMLKLEIIHHFRRLFIQRYGKSYVDEQ